MPMTELAFRTADVVLGLVPVVHNENNFRWEMESGNNDEVCVSAARWNFLLHESCLQAFFFFRQGCYRMQPSAATSELQMLSDLA